MRLLVLGGTAWLGRCIAATAAERGHHVTYLARGESGAAPPGAAFARADRDGPGAYREAAREEWDVVIDVSRQPGQVRRATATLAGRAGSFVYVSSTSVYAGHATPGAGENAALLPALAGEVMASMDTYGQAKLACEQHVLSGFGPDRYAWPTSSRTSAARTTRLSSTAATGTRRPFRARKGSRTTSSRRSRRPVQNTRSE
jgi:nucleoside-diphosphate-sugar epimerase